MQSQLKDADLSSLESDTDDSVSSASSDEELWNYLIYLTIYVHE